MRGEARRSRPASRSAYRTGTPGDDPGRPLSTSKRRPEPRALVKCPSLQDALELIEGSDQSLIKLVTFGGEVGPSSNS